MPLDISINQLVDNFQQPGSPLDKVKNPHGRLDVLASNMIQFAAVKSGNVALAMGALLLKPTIDRAIVSVVGNRRIKLASGSRQRAKK